VRVCASAASTSGDRRPKHVREFAGRRFDRVISLCDRVREVCPDFAGAPAVAHWSIADPAAEGTEDEQSYPAFVRMADELSTRIEFLLSTIQHELATKEGRRHERRPG
jgi:protein-tyrosine-phosphatase